MIRARIGDAVFLVLSGTNLDRLRKGEPIRVRRDVPSLNETLWSGDLGQVILMFGGETEDDIRELGRKMGEDGPRALLDRLVELEGNRGEGADG